MFALVSLDIMLWDLSHYLFAYLLVVCNLLKASESKSYPFDCRVSVEFFYLSSLCKISARANFFLVVRVCRAACSLPFSHGTKHVLLKASSVCEEHHDNFCLYLLSVQGILYLDNNCLVQSFSWHFHVTTIHFLSFKGSIAGLWSRLEPGPFLTEADAWHKPPDNLWRSLPTSDTLWFCDKDYVLQH